MTDMTTNNTAPTGEMPIGGRPRSVAVSERLAIAVGGAAGAYTRVIVNQLIGTSGNGWPWATFCVNIAGAFLLGYLIARLLERLPPSTYRRALLGTGFCGALTTFSTLQIRAAESDPHWPSRTRAGLRHELRRTWLRSIHGRNRPGSPSASRRMNIAPIAWPLIGIAGAIGAICRFTLDRAVERRSSSRFPLGTLSVNVSGATVLGFLHGLGASSTLALVVGTAGIGTYTTFSTLIFETERLLEDNDRLLAATNILGSMILGLNAVLIGWWIGTSM